MLPHMTARRSLPHRWRLLPKKGEGRLGLRLLIEKHMTRLGNVHQPHPRGELLTQGMPIRRWGDTICESLYD